MSRVCHPRGAETLNAEGLVQWANNRGGSVTKHSLDEIGEIFDLRILIEVDLFRRAIPNMGPREFARCDEILKQMEASYDENDVRQVGDIELSISLGALCGFTAEADQRIAGPRQPAIGSLCKDAPERDETARTRKKGTS